ncbi:MAG: hypothetical protein GXN99_00605 [Candidatus Nanohaloarchaeota archaeon]|nr:hypothetical protein [Candidatus Nanohaloarchaeota archaeon]
MILNATRVITEKEIKKRTIAKEKTNIKEKALKDLKQAYKSGLISKEAYEKALQKIEKKEEEKESCKTQKPSPAPSQQESSPHPQQTANQEQQNKEKKEEVKQYSIKKKYIKELEEMKKNWIKDLESLKKLHDHGIISDEEYERSKADIESKIEKIENLIKRELEKEELEALKQRIEKEIKEAFQKGIFKEEEEQYKKDLEALENLYKRGLISEEEYLKKKEELKQKIGNYDKLIELIDAIFNKYIEELSKKVETIKEETTPKQPTEEPKPQEEKPQPKQLSFILRILHKLGLYEIKETEVHHNKLKEEITKAFKESEPRFKISNIALVIKKEVKEKLNIKEAVTYSELIEKIKASKEFDEHLKSKLINFFNNVIIKEYLEDEDEKDIELIYKEALEIAELLEGQQTSNTINRLVTFLI